MRIFRQGDILFREINDQFRYDTWGGFSLWEDVGKEYTVAYGETSGHKHMLTSSEDIQINDVDGDNVWLRLMKPGKVTHEEHGQVNLPKGDYEVVHEREQDHAKNATPQVAD